MSQADRDIRMQIMLQPDEMGAIEDWRFGKRMPSRAAAVREPKASNLQKLANTRHPSESPTLQRQIRGAESVTGAKRGDSSRG